MISLWLVIAIVVCFCIGFVWFSVRQAEGEQLIEGKISQSKLVLILPLILLLASPIVYLSWGGYQQQNSWNDTVERSQPLLAQGNTANIDLDIQELMLALRTQAFRNPDNGQIWFDLGKAYAALRMNDLAISSMERALRIESDSDWAVALAQLLAANQNIEDLQKAVGVLQQVLTINPSHQSALLTLGFSHFKMADYANAIQTWQKLAEQDNLSSASKTFIEQQISQAKQLMSKNS